MNFFVYFIKRQFLRQLLAVFILFLFAQSYSFSQQPEQIQLEPSILLGLEQNNSFSDKNLSSTDIISLALEYSLCPLQSEEGGQCLKIYHSLENSAKEQLALLPQMEAADRLLHFIHSSILKKYREGCTRLNETLLTGNYNCVTASVLYFALARSLGLTVYGQETSVHAFCTVLIDGQKIDVETTNPYGFNPGVKKVVEQSENSRKYTVIPKKYYSNRREISDRAMATLTGKNVASDLNDTGDYETAIPLEISRLEFLKLTDDSELKTAKADLDTLTCNYALELSKNGMEESALGFMEQICQKYGESQNLQKMYDNIAYNQAANLLNNRQESIARQSFEQHRRNISPSMQTKIDTMITKQVLHTHEISVHNQITPMFNNGDYKKVKEILTEALQKNPSSSLLKKDLQIVNRALSL